MNIQLAFYLPMYNSSSFDELEYGYAIYTVVILISDLYKVMSLWYIVFSLLKC